MQITGNYRRRLAAQARDTWPLGVKPTSGLVEAARPNRFVTSAEETRSRSRRSSRRWRRARQHRARRRRASLGESFYRDRGSATPSRRYQCSCCASSSPMTATIHWCDRQYLPALDGGRRSLLLIVRTQASLVASVSATPHRSRNGRLASASSGPPSRLWKAN